MKVVSRDLTLYLFWVIFTYRAGLGRFSRKEDKTVGDLSWDSRESISHLCSTRRGAGCGGAWGICRDRVEWIGENSAIICSGGTSKKTLGHLPGKTKKWGALVSRA